MGVFTANESIEPRRRLAVAMRPLAVVVVVLAASLVGRSVVRANWSVVNQGSWVRGFYPAAMFFTSTTRGVMVGAIRATRSAPAHASIFWTRDSGRSWHQAAIRVNSADMQAITFSGVWFSTVRLGWAIGAANGHCALVKTTDGGRNWRTMALPPFILHAGSGTNPGSVWFGPAGRKGRLLPLSGNVFWQTLNAGKTWQTVHVGHQFGGPRWLGSWNKMALVGSNGFLLLTHNAGRTWKMVQSGLKTGLRAISFAPGGKAGWAIGGDGEYLRNGGWGMYADPVILHTTDGGLTWTRQNVPPGRTGSLTDVWAVSPQEAWVSSMVGYARTNPSSALPWLLHTTDGGKTWRNQQRHIVSVRQLFFLNSGCGWAFGGQGGSPQEPYAAALLQYVAGGRAKHAPSSRGLPITVQVPRREHVSINIFGRHGRVIREIMTGAIEKKGLLTVYWNGRDQWGAPVPLGTYKWGAYFSPGIRPQYMGTVGSSGRPPYPTLNGLGGWGGDHGPPIAAAADRTGLYFLWTVSEALCNVIKLNYQFHTVWRVRVSVGGAFTPSYAIASNGKYVFVAYRGSRPLLARLDARNGQLLPWPHGSVATPISNSTMVAVPPGASPIAIQPECCGVAANATEVFTSVYSRNQIRVLSAQSGRLLRTLKCPGPRGLCLDPAGNLWAASYLPGRPGKIMEFAHAAGIGRTVVADSLVAPWGVAVDAAGRIHVTDDGSSQQVKVFAPTGRLVQTLGAVGGRPWSGKYVAANYLEPAGIAADDRGQILTAQASLPKVFSLNAAATGKLIRQWFGGIGYWGALTADPINPRITYYELESPGANYDGLGFARAAVIGPEKVAAPQAYWLGAAYPGLHPVGPGGWLPQTDVVLGTNHRKYFVCDTNPHGIALIQGNQLLPVAYFRAWSSWQKGNPFHANALQIWSDANGDHRVEPGEVHVLTKLAGRPLPEFAGSPGSMWMSRQGDIYLATEANSIIEIPASGFSADGAIQWDLAKAHYAVPVVLGRAGSRLFTGYRDGILGMRVDSHGNLYTCVNATVPYYTPGETRAMGHGIGHDDCCNAVKFMKFAPNGKLLWMAGRKAANQAGHGLLHHFWVIAGMVGNRYVAGGSEWGQIYFYTHDGFYVGALLNNPTQAPLPGPYTGGGEDACGVVKYYPKLNQVWAYNEGMAYRVLGFNHGRVQGQSREWGHVVLGKVLPSKWGQGVTAKGNLVIAPLRGRWQSAAAWKSLPARRIKRGGKMLARVQLGLDGQYFCARFKVTHNGQPLNGAHSPRLVFNDGDSVGVDLGPWLKQPHGPVLGDMRILAALVNGKPRLVAMVPLSRKLHAPANYFTPAGGHVDFAFVGYVPGGQVYKQPWAHGYIMTLAVPRRFLRVPLTAGHKVAMDVEVNFSGYTNEGLQVVTRNYLFSPQNDADNTVSDIPTEAKLHPQWWGVGEIK